VSKEELDPEVVADLRLRAYSEKDSSRSRGEGAYDWKPAPTVTQWKCRVPACKTFVDVTPDAVESWEMFNRELARRDERPVASHEVMWCASCAEMHAGAQSQRLRKMADRMADVIRQIKAGDKVIRWRSSSGEHAGDENEAFAALKRWGHPDIEGFKQAIGDKRNTTPSKRERRGGL